MHVTPFSAATILVFAIASPLHARRTATAAGSCSPEHRNGVAHSMSSGEVVRGYTTRPRRIAAGGTWAPNAKSPIAIGNFATDSRRVRLASDP